MRKNIVTSLCIAASFIFITSSASALTCTTLTRSLSKGSENNEVLALQQFLFDGGFLAVKPNGYFGENTRKAVILFQKRQKISMTGTVGPLTRAKIQEMSCMIVPASLNEKKSSNVVASDVGKVLVVTKNTQITTGAQEVPASSAVHEIPTIYVKTFLASDITPNSATLKGVGGIDGEKHWFEWGTTMEMKNVTPQVAASTSYSYKMTGLLSNTSYFFRAVTSVASSTERKGEIAYGERRYFTTPPAAVAALPVPTVSVSSTGAAVNPQGSVRVTWVSANTNVCSFTGGEEGGNWAKQGSLSGEYITQPMTKSAIFTITCKNNLQYTVTSSVTVSKIVN